MSDSVPACRHFGQCGGCSALDVPIAEQLARKKARVAAALAPFLRGLDIAVDPPAHPPRFDRMKLLYPAQMLRLAPGNAETLCTGLFAAGTHDLLPIEECSIQARALTLLAQRVTDVLRAHAIDAYDERTQTGCLRALHARIAPGTGELLVGLVTHTPELPHAAAITQAITTACADLPAATRRPIHLVGVVHNVHTTPGNYLLGPEVRVLTGRDHLFDRSDGLTFRISFSSFYQVHRHAAALLYRPALRLLGDVRGARVLDGYGGVGTFALRLLAMGASGVDLVEASPSACADAHHNATLNRLAERVRVHQAPFASADLGGEIDVAVVDPPRSGLGQAGCDRLLTLQPARVLYVSCAVDSLARDLATLSPAYLPRAVQLCDMFPHTVHSELLVFLHRNRIR